MILRFGLRHAFAGDELRTRRVATLLGELHRLDQALADMAHDPAARRLLLGVEPELLEKRLHDLDVALRLLQILLPFLAQLIVADAGKRRSCRRARRRPRSRAFAVIVRSLAVTFSSPS